MDVRRLLPQYRAAELLFAYEDTFQRIQDSYFQKVYTTGARSRVEGIVRNVQIYMPRRDRAKVLAVFFDDYGGVHIVWSDEYVPLPGLDHAYREIRREKYGRTADVESIHIVGEKVKFPTTYGPPNVYETSIHSDGEESLNAPLTIYVWTWNHLMALNPSVDVLMKGGYYLATGYEVRRGTRRDAERYAREVSGGG